MNILIVGCGRMGASLAGMLCREGHDVSVVDRHESSFSLLPEDYNGYTTVGVPIDQDVLRRAGIESCDAVAAVSPDDNVNIMVSQLAKRLFKVKTVIARIYDPARESVYSHFGLDTICPTNIAVDSVRSALLSQQSQQLHFGCSTLSFRTIPVPERLIGVSTDDIEEPADQQLFAVLRGGQTLLAGKEALTLQSGDQLIIARVSD
ncbi:MAG: TrkA family potassium uptake protein [Oscillospiraceae bacterium]|nr:TrkA family potassium uptake protein [Oscillospiraceae bacterium]